MGWGAAKQGGGQVGRVSGAWSRHTCALVQARCSSVWCCKLACEDGSGGMSRQSRARCGAPCSVNQSMQQRDRHKIVVQHRHAHEHLLLVAVQCTALAVLGWCTSSAMHAAAAGRAPPCAAWSRGSAACMRGSAGGCSACMRGSAGAAACCILGSDGTPCKRGSAGAAACMRGSAGTGAMGCGAAGCGGYCCMCCIGGGCDCCGCCREVIGWGATCCMGVALSEVIG